MDIRDTLEAFDRRELTAEQAVVVALARIADPRDQGRVAFLEVFGEQALGEARAWDGRRAQGLPLPPLAGIPFSVKDNFDVRGSTTRAASPVLDGMPPAIADAPFLSRIRALGAVLVGRTNMTAFAYSGLGLNPHHGTPRSPFGRDAGLIAGGSTSGGAVSVAEGMVSFAIGSDTSGSCRIPAACCGLVGYRPSKTRHSIDGIVPLAPTFDVPGLITRDVAGMGILLAAMGGRTGSDSVDDVPGHDAAASGVAGRRFLVPTDEQLTETDPDIQRRFTAVLSALRSAGATIEFGPFFFDTIATSVVPSEVLPHEALWLHGPLLAARRDRYDPRIAMRLDQAKLISAATYRERIEELHALRGASDRLLKGYDAVLLPTLPIVPPTIDQVQDVAEYTRLNSLIIRNTAVANHLDLPALALPMGLVSEARLPASLQVIGRRDGDEALLAIATALELIANQED